MAFSKNTYNQIRNISRKKFIKALERDGFVRDEESNQGAILVFWNPSSKRRVTVHWHPQQGFGKHRLPKMLEAAGWTTEEDLRRVRLMK